MNNFDFIDASIRGYKSVWDNRIVLARIAALPFFIKIGSFAVVLLMGLEMNFLRQGLVLLPSYFAEGFLVAYVIRVTISGQDIMGDVRAARPFARDLMAATITYVLIKLTLAFVAGMTFLQSGAAALGGASDDGAVSEGVSAESLSDASATASTIPEASPGMFFLMLGTLVFMIWAFRLMWLYVPIAMGRSAGAFLNRAPQYSLSFTMIGTWLLCFVPMGIVLMLIYEVLASALGHSLEAPSALLPVLLLPVQSSIEIVIALVSSVAMAYGIQQIFDNKDA